MAVYYVTHPNIEIDAKVDAPTTEKARTTFLDYLERTGRMSRRNRSYLRENLVAERLSDDGEGITADVSLSYYYGFEDTARLQPDFEVEHEPMGSVQEGYVEPEYGEGYIDPEYEERRSEGESRERVALSSPIAEASLGGHV